MNTGSRDEQMLLANVARIAKALERIADSLDDLVKLGHTVASVIPRPKPKSVA